MHQLSVNDRLVHSHAIVLSICRVGSRRDLNLTPLPVRGGKLATSGSLFEFFVDALFFDTTFTLDEGRV